MKRLWGIAVLFFIILLNSCQETGPIFKILAGNYALRQGRYHRAILYYLRVDSQVGGDVVHYNLGNVYYALGEGEAALNSWARAEEITQDKEILFRIHFNWGVLYYHWGRFEKAYLSFQQALLLEPTSRDAKINLELAFARIPVNSPTPTSLLPPEESEATREEDTLRLLEYIKRKESQTWLPASEALSTTVDDW